MVFHGLELRVLLADRRARREVEKTLSFASDIAWHCISSACVQEKNSILVECCRESSSVRSGVKLEEGLPY